MATMPWADLAETHTAVVLFLGDRAVKIRKPLAFDFLDLRTVAARREVTRREVELNSRLAPDVYLGITEIDLGGGVHEPAVVMRRLPDTRRLSALVCADPGAAESAVRQVAHVVAAFHSGLDPVHRPEQPVPRLSRLWGQVLGDLVDDSRYARDARRCLRLATVYLAGRQPLFAERVDGGRVRDGHGDLQADDIFVLDDGPRILDCLEFDDDLRVDDVLLDVCFLAMDLERLGAPVLARVFLDTYRELTNETHPRSLEDFFIAYRAAVRARVTAIRAAQGDRDAPATAALLLSLCERHLVAAVPVVILVGGLPGAGKTTVATDLAERRGWTVLSSDLLRQELSPDGGGGEGTGEHDWEEGRYAPDATRRVYDEMLARAAVAVARGECVVLDASWRDAETRSQARRMATAHSCVHVEVECHVDDDVAAARLESRVGGVSDATVDIRRRMTAVFDSWPEAIRLATYGDVADELDAALAARIADVLDVDPHR